MTESEARQKRMRRVTLPGDKYAEVEEPKGKVDFKQQMDSLYKKPKVDRDRKTVNIDKSVSFMFNELKF